MYFDAADDCNNINFNFGATANGVTAKATRQFDIKVSQINCKAYTLIRNICSKEKIVHSRTAPRQLTSNSRQSETNFTKVNP